MTSDFKDHFSDAAKDYADNRPRYPKPFLEYIVSLAVKRELAWDCATGNGQAALDLADYFNRMIATDASEQQISNATRHEKIEYRIAKAESSGLDNSSVDLITVATAVHWFDFEKFYEEARRVGKRECVLVVFGYDLYSISSEIDAIIRTFYEKTVGPFWPVERRFIEDRYTTIPFPFKEIGVLNFVRRDEWNLEQLLSHLGTWSSVIKYKEVKKEDPLILLRQSLIPIWKAGSRTVVRPLFSRAGWIHGYPEMNKKGNPKAADQET